MKPSSRELANMARVRSTSLRLEKDWTTNRICVQIAPLRSFTEVSTRSPRPVASPSSLQSSTSQMGCWEKEAVTQQFWEAVCGVGKASVCWPTTRR